MQGGGASNKNEPLMEVRDFELPNRSSIEDSPNMMFMQKEPIANPVLKNFEVASKQMVEASFKPQLVKDETKQKLLI